MNRLLIAFAAAALVASAAPRHSQQSSSQSQQNQSQQNRNAQNRNDQQQQKSSGSAERTQDTTITTDSKTTKTSTDTIYGKVQAYQLNKSIQITVPGKTESTRTIDLTGNNLTARVAPNVKVGDWVKLEQKTDNNGNKTVMVERSTQRAARMMSEEQARESGKSGQQGQGGAQRQR